MKKEQAWDIITSYIHSLLKEKGPDKDGLFRLDSFLRVRDDDDSVYLKEGIYTADLLEAMSWYIKNAYKK